jgi:CelD/BcsL family acetyltransferase involved in cellulose biosynthesis
MLKTTVLSECRALERRVPEWRRLLERASNAQPVLTPLWLLTWWREFGDQDGRFLRAIAIDDGDELVGLVPLARRATAHRRAIPVRRLELLATGEDEEDEIGSDYVGVLAVRGREDDVAEAAARAIGEGRLGDWDELRMPAMSGDDALIPKLEAALRKYAISAEVTPSGESPYIPLPGTWDEYTRALGSSRRYVVTRSLRELEKWSGGKWEVRRAATPGELDEGTAVLRELHAERWGAEGRSGVFASERFSRFHATVMPRLLAGEDGASLDLSWLVVRGRAVAAAYSIVYGGKLHFYQSGRRVDVPRAVRPGIALHAMAIRSAIESGLREYDFLAGASRYKRELSLATRPLLTLRAVGRGMRARSVEAVRVLTEGAIARMRTVQARMHARRDAASREHASG